MQRKLTNQLLAAASAVVIGGLFSAGPVLAQVAPQPFPLKRVDVQNASGYRTSQLVGGPVFDEHGDKIGTIDDLIIDAPRRPGKTSSRLSEKAPFAILSIGAFLGIGEHLVVVPLHSLKISENKGIQLPGATKASLEAMPEFRYTKK
jgi:sporulation protein YlmC with PRC-barrel domain